MSLGADLIGAGAVLYPRTGNEWYGFGMNSYTVNYNVVRAGTH